MTKEKVAGPDALPRLLRVARRLTQQKDVPRLLETLLDEAQLLCHADNGVVWLYADGHGQPRLKCLRRAGGARQGLLHEAQEWTLALASASPDCLPMQCFQRDMPVEAALSMATACELDRRLAASLVAEPRNLYLLPLHNHEGTVIGVLQLINARQHELEPAGAMLLRSLVAYAGIALNNLSQVEDLKALLDAFIKVLAQAIDAKSSHTSAHCQRVPVLTELLAQAACDDGDTFADFSLDEDGWYELHVAAWLHDCGKLATPDSVLDKSTKLHTLHDRISEVASRFAGLRAQAGFDYEKQCLHDPSGEPRYRQQLETRIEAITDDLTFLERINRGGETMAQDDQRRVREIAARSWVDAWGQRRPLLTDDEVENLCIVRGTLTEQERQVINGHMDVTLDMLESLPFPRKLRRVPEYAGGHHEKMDGSGFPRGLTREQMSIPARIMAIADVFEALTSKERPYKMPLRLSEALAIMQRMRDNQHLDPDLYQLFIRSGVWRQYGQQFLDPQQRDVDDAGAFL